MNVTSYRSEIERANIFTLKVNDVDLFSRKNLNELEQEIRYQLAGRIVDLIMQKISPAIDGIFKESDK